MATPTAYTAHSGTTGAKAASLPSSVLTSGLGEIGAEIKLDQSTLKDDGLWNKEGNFWFRYKKDRSLDAAGETDATVALNDLDQANNALKCKDGAGCDTLYNVGGKVADLFNFGPAGNKDKIITNAKKVNPGDAHMILRNSRFEIVEEDVTLPNGKKIRRVIPETVEKWIERGVIYNAKTTALYPPPMSDTLAARLIDTTATAAADRAEAKKIVQFLHVMRAIVIAYPQSLNPAETEGKVVGTKKYGPVCKDFAIYDHLPAKIMGVNRRARRYCEDLARLRVSAKITLGEEYMGTPFSIFRGGGRMMLGGAASQEGGADELHIPLQDVQEFIGLSGELQKMLKEMMELMDTTKKGPQQYRVGLRKQSLEKVEKKLTELADAGKQLIELISEFNNWDRHKVLSGDKIDLFQLDDKFVYPDAFTAEQKKKYEGLFQLRQAYGQKFMKGTSLLEQIAQAMVAATTPSAAAAPSDPRYV